MEENTSTEETVEHPEPDDQFTDETTESDRRDERPRKSPRPSRVSTSSSSATYPRSTALELSAPTTSPHGCTSPLWPLQAA